MKDDTWTYLHRWLTSEPGNELSVRRVSPNTFYMRVRHYKPDWRDPLTVSVIVEADPAIADRTVKDAVMRLDREVADELVSMGD